MVIFGADGNSVIGSGHIMRCLSVADEFRTQGKSCSFFSSSICFKSLIEGHGHNFCISDYDFREPQYSRIPEYIDSGKIEAIFIDSYFVSADCLLALHTRCRRNSCKLIYIDDVLAFPYPCDILINYNIFGKLKHKDYISMYSESPDVDIPKFLLGAEYAPLRREFCALPIRSARHNARRILVTSGGADTEHIALGMLEMTSEYADYTFDFVIGSLNGDIEEILNKASVHPNAVLHINAGNMCELMRNADAAIASAGSTLYELCAASTPTVTYTLADNQIPGAKTFDELGVMKYIGDIRDNDRNEFLRTLLDNAARLCADYDMRRKTMEIMASIVDGNGCSRIVQEICRS